MKCADAGHCRMHDDPVYHENVPGQPNERLLHEKAWSEHCPYCFVAALAELPEVSPVETYKEKTQKLLDGILEATLLRSGDMLAKEITKSFIGTWPKAAQASLTNQQLKGVLSAAGYSEGPEPASQEEAVDPATEEQDSALD